MAALASAEAHHAQVSISYGATEMQGGMIECHPGAGLHNPLPAQFQVDVVHPETGRTLGEGEPGIVLLTHLERRGTVLLRYALGDISALTREPCPYCGAVTDRLIRTPRRADALVKVKGMLVNPDAVIAELERHLGAAPFKSRLSMTLTRHFPETASGSELSAQTMSRCPAIWPGWSSKRVG